MTKTSTILITEPSSDYALLDSGEGEKLERFGKFTLARPDPQALWKKRLDEKEWKKADGRFSRDEAKGSWSLKPELPERWEISFADLTFWIKPTPFKHTGLFPEQAGNWECLRSVIPAPDVARGQAPAGIHEKSDHLTLDPPLKGGTPSVSEDGGILNPAMSGASAIEILNLFGYTGAATLACAQAGAKVVHVDGSKAALAWARENAELSGLKDKPVRWILDDARTFVGREIKRDRKYQGIIMDPPAFGHGPDNEVWKIEEDLLPLVESCFSILSDKPLFFLINGYASGYSALAYENMLMPLVKKFGGRIEIGELAIQESPLRSQASSAGQAQIQDLDSRLLPCGIFARWSGK